LKHITALTLSALFVFSSGSIYAAPVGNIAAPSLLKKGIIYDKGDMDFTVTASGEIDLTFDQKFDNQDNSTEYYFFGMKAGLLVAERFMPYAMLGGASADKQQFQIGGRKVRWDTDYDYAWGLGCTAMLFEKKLSNLNKGILRIGIDGKYRQSDLDVKKIKIDDNTALKATDPNVNAATYELRQWQAALGVSYQIDQIVPYFGVKYSGSGGKATAAVEGDDFTYKFDNRYKVGMFVGGDLVVNDSFTLNIEGRFIDETALTLSGATRF
jgi:hypothetical protein